MRFIRRVANRSLDYLLFNRLSESYWLNKMRGKIICLLYHRVDDTEKYSFLTKGGIPTIHPAELESDLRFLMDRGAKFFTFKDLREGKFPGRNEIGVMVTFDDGFKDNYTTALEVLNKLDIRATIFQSTAMVDSKTLLWEHSLYWYLQSQQHQDLIKEKLVVSGLDGIAALATHEGLHLASYLRENISAPLLVETMKDLLSSEENLEQEKLSESIYPSSDQIRKAFDAGHEIGSHGHNHYKRINISKEEFENELIMSKVSLNKILPTDPLCFSYPFNSYEAGDKEICRKYFKQVATVDGGFIEYNYNFLMINRVTWPGTARNTFRRRRWLMTGNI